MKIGKRMAFTVASILAVMMALDMPAKELAGSIQISKTAQAAETTKYVGDVRLACGGSSDGAEDTLTKDGYTVVDGDLNETTKEDYVYMGYKTTTDPSKGITDIRALKQDNGYTIFDSKELMGQFDEEAAEDAIYLMRMVKEFRKNYEDHQYFATNIYDIFQQYQMEEGKMLGDYLLDPDLTDTDLTEIVLFADPHMSIGLYQFLRVALIRDDRETCFTRIQAVEDEDVEVTSKVKSKARAILTAVKSFQTYVENTRTNLQESAKETENTDQKNIEVETAEVETAEKQKAGVVADLVMCVDHLTNINYMGQDLSTFFLNKDLKASDLYAIADCFTDAEVQALKFLGISSFVNLSQWNEEKFTEGTKDTKKQEGEVVDFWQGSAKTDNSRIAVTNDMLQQMIVGNTTSLSASIVNERNIGLWTGTGLSMLATGITAVYYVTRVNTWAKGFAEAYKVIHNLPWYSTIDAATEMLQLGKGVSAVDLRAPAYVVNAYKAMSANAKMTLKAMSEGAMSACTDTATTAARAAMSGTRATLTVSIVLTVVAILISAIFLILDVMDYYKADYSEFPPTVLSLEKLEDGSDAYVTYHAVMDGDKVGDTNARQGRKWNALYYTTSSAMGTPIRAGSLKGFTSTQNSNSDLIPVALFGQQKAFDLNTNTFSHDSGTYLYYSRVDANTLASVFAMSNSMIILLIALGLLIIGIGTIVIKRKKKVNSGQY